MKTAVPTLDPALPVARGPLSGALIDLLAERAPQRDLVSIEAALADTEPLGLDVQLALAVCYELHYRGFAGVDAGWEWNPKLLHLRARLEQAFLAAVRDEVGDIDADVTAEDEMAALTIERTDESGPSFFLRDQGTWEQVREYFVHYSPYHLKEGDPHAWVIPRLVGQAKAAFVAIEYDEFGAGRGSHVHAQLFAELLAAAGLDWSYLGYLDQVPAEALAVVNLMSLFGLHRAHRGAAIGHFASTEITSPPGSRRMVQALERLGAPDECVFFYREHVEADAVHEQVVRTDVVGDLLKREPHLNADVVFGIRARDVVESRLAAHMLTCWESGKTSLRQRL